MSSIEAKYDFILSFFKVLILLQTVLQNGKQIVIYVYIGQNSFAWEG